MASVPTGTFRTFAYGSNMLSARIRARCPTAQALGVAELRGYELRWHKRSVDGSGKCNVVPVGASHATVLGVVYEIDAGEKKELDRAEGLGSGYEEKYLRVMLDGRPLDVSVYRATDTEPSLRPYTWYKTLVLAGANEHGLPQEYVSRIEATEATQDPNHRRHDRNMQIVSSANGEGRR